MIIGVLSDSHSNLQSLRDAAAALTARSVRTVIHCGDICSVAAVETLRRLDVHWVFGNCDLDHELLRQTMIRNGHTCHGLLGSLETGEHRVGFTHGHRSQLLETMVADRRHRYVCHGHTHVIRDETVDGVRVLCPGALANAQPLSMLVLDTGSGAAEWVEL